MTTTIKPRDVEINNLGTVGSSLGRFETEAVAAILVRYHVAKGLEEWSPVTPREIADFMVQDPDVREWSSNLFWKMADPQAMVAGGWIAGWETPESPGTVTEKFLQALAKPRPK